MPIVEFHLTEGRQSDDEIGALLEQATDFYVRTLYPAVDPLPLDRVRAFVSLHRPQHWATAGVLASDGERMRPILHASRWREGRRSSFMPCCADLPISSSRIAAANAAMCVGR